MERMVRYSARPPIDLIPRIGATIPPPNRVVQLGPALKEHVTPKDNRAFRFEGALPWAAIATDWGRGGGTPTTPRSRCARGWLPG
jgi:hypothetical protein